MSLNTSEILKSIVRDPSSVKYHHYWGDYIEVNFPFLRMIGLIEGENGSINLSLYFGDSQQQAREFYMLNPAFEKLDNTWTVKPNFHLSNSFRNLFWFDTPKGTSVKEYFNFWKNHGKLLYQHKRKDLGELITYLNKNGIIKYDVKTEIEFYQQILNKEYSQFNICPGIGVIYTISHEEASRLKQRGELYKLLIRKIDEALGIVNVNGNSFLRADPPDF
jgi:hypothetical protein